MSMESNKPQPGDESPCDARREVLAKIGRFAYAAPALALLTEPKSARAEGYGGPKPGNGFGDVNHDHGGPPGLIDKILGKH